MATRRLFFAYILVALATIMSVSGLAWLLFFRFIAQPLRLSIVVSLILVPVAIAVLLGWAVSRKTLRRLSRVAKISQIWLRGDLSPHIADPSADELGQISRQLDQLIRQYGLAKQDLDELRARETRLSDQVRALSMVEERNRLARDLHDGVKQHVFSLSMTASAVQDRLKTDPSCAAPDLAEMINQMKLTTQTVQREMTQLIEDLRPASLQERGLELALNDYCLLFGAREHLLIYLDVHGDTTLIPPSLAETFYIVTQEALTNIASHARATRVDVCLNTLPEQTTLTVRDNGAGFDQSRPQQGLGISNMRERLMSLGGRLTIESQTGLGTLVTAEAGLARPLPTSPNITRLDENRPLPEISNWAWLGQKLTIPVGETWPWSLNDEVHLHGPVIECLQTPLVVKRTTGFLGLGKASLIEARATGATVSRLLQNHSGTDWIANGAHWSFRKLSGLTGKQVLYRNGQPLAAVQYQGRQMNNWSEFIYAGHGYRLSGGQQPENPFSLADESGQELLHICGDGPLEIHLLRSLPVPLMNMAALRYFEECDSTKLMVDSST